MSRIRLQPNDDHADRGIEVYIGFEPALKTYFAQVFDGLDADGEEIMPVDLGNEPGEIKTPHAAIEALEPYAEIPDDLYERLRAGRHQRDMTYTNLTRPDPTSEPDPLASTKILGMDRREAAPLRSVAGHGLHVVSNSSRAGDQRGGALLPEQTETCPMPVNSRPQIEGLDR
ncbi:hypothetical protein AB0C65_32815 [Nocardia sp. NPDC048505]|uniref:hypothetical protein n=1 Tax=Nocardia sp. NPDC048505 TaxID=3155756 RepID=UPI0033FF9285